MPPAAARTLAAFVAQLEPHNGGSRPGAGQRQAIEKKLRAQLGTPVTCILTGSAALGTGIKDHSAIDLLVPVPPQHVQSDSALMLRWLAEITTAALPSVEIVVDGTSVQVPFGPGKAERHYLAPASSIERTTEGDDIYVVPDGAGGWRRMSPGNHRRYVDHQDRRADASARPLIRLVKAWKHFNNVPISSFYLELIAANYVAQQSPVMYGQALGDLFTGFLQGQLAPFTDPTGVCGAVLPVRHVFDQVAAMEAVAQAAVIIEEARAAARANRLERSMRHWKRLYNGGFSD